MTDMNDSRDCSCEESRRRWKAMRLLLLLAGLSLALYMPWKAATQYASLESIYGPWFLQGAVVAVAGILFMARPGLAPGVPLWLRLGVGVAALLWMRTGLACTPSLVASIQQSVLSGGFATFHMMAQHIFLSAGVLGMAAAPKYFAERMGGLTSEPEADRSAASSGGGDFQELSP